METKNVQMTEEEYKVYLEMKKKTEEAEAKERRRQDMEAYRHLVDATLIDVGTLLLHKNRELTEAKAYVLDVFRDVIKMKQDVMGIKEGGQFSHTFTDSESTVRVTIGYNTIDSYMDTVNEGIAMVREYIESLAGDANSQTLVRMILKLLSTDKQGNLKASRVVQLRKYADESGNARFIEGVELIEKAYTPTKTKQYIRLEIKDEKTNGWRNIPLSMTDVEDTIDVPANDEEKEISKDEECSDDGTR